MVTQTMGSHGGGGAGESKSTPGLVRQGSLYSLTLDEVQNHLGDLGKPLSSMNLDELLKTVWTAEGSQAYGIDADNMSAESCPLAPATYLHRQPSLTMPRDLSKKTVDEVWREIQGGQSNSNNQQRAAQERRPTLGEMTLEDFLVKAGVVTETTSVKKNFHALGIDPIDIPQHSLPQQAQWMQFQLSTMHQPQQQQHQKQNMTRAFLQGNALQQPLPVAVSQIMEAAYPETQMTMPHTPLMSTLSDTQTPGRKRVGLGDLVEKTVERRQKRMIKNRESAARSRARKQAYTNELENKVSRLEEENEKLKKQREVEKMLQFVPPPEPKYQLRRTSSAPF